MPRTRWRRPAGAGSSSGRPGIFSISKEAQESVALFAGLALAITVAVAVVILVVALKDDDANGVVGNGTGTARPTQSGGSGEPTPTDPTKTPGPSRSPSASPTPVVTPSVPGGQPAFGFWANKENAWWFGDLTDEVAEYEEGEYVPFMVRWDPVPGQTYELALSYDCMTYDALGAFDYLSGIEQWGRDPLFAEYGPAKDLPDAAVPVPDTAGFAVDDNEAGVFTLYGGKFVSLPTGPSPGESCTGQRTINITIEAAGGPLTLIGSGHLALASVWGPDEGASSNDPAFAMRVTVGGVGSAGLFVGSSAIADIEH